MMIMNKRFAVMMLAAFMFTGVFMADSCYAAPKKTGVSSIPEENRPSTAAPWFMGITLSAGAVVVGVKNSKRTHLD